MSEIISTYLLEDPDTEIPMDRKEFYEEQIAVFKETGVPTRAAEVIHVFIFNTSGQLLLQKRSFNKDSNPGLIDKSIGGHVQYDDTVNHTVMVETVQELQTPSIVLNNQKDFDKTLTVLNSYLATIAIMKGSDSKIYNSKRQIKGEIVTIAHKGHLFFGVYDGRVKTADKEAQGILFYTLEELAQEMKNFPDLFTSDLHVLMEKFGTDLTTFADSITNPNPA